MQTIEGILTDSTSMKLLPTHCINSAGELEGFALSVPAKASGGALPINRTMFHGTSLYEVVCRAGNFNPDVMRLQQTADIRETMKSLMQQVSDGGDGKEVSRLLPFDFQGADLGNHQASFRCVPDNVDLLSSVGSNGNSHVIKTTGKRSVDFADWQPELPHSIGLYQAFCRGYQKDLRAHKMFIGVNGGLNRCSDEFYNLLLDVGKEFTCQVPARAILSRCCRLVSDVQGASRTWPSRKR
jgi:hypothetical protein